MPISFKSKSIFFIPLIIILLGGIGYYVYTLFSQSDLPATQEPVGMIGNEVIYTTDLEAMKQSGVSLNDLNSLWDRAVQQSQSLQYAHAIGLFTLEENFFNSANKDLEHRKTKYNEINEILQGQVPVTDFTVHTMYYSLPLESSDEERNTKRSQTTQLLREYIEIYQKDPASSSKIISRAAELDPNNANRPLSLHVSDHNPFIPGIYSPYFKFFNNAEKGTISQPYYTSVLNMNDQYQEGITILEITEVKKDVNLSMHDVFTEYKKNINIERYEN